MSKFKIGDRVKLPVDKYSIGNLPWEKTEVYKNLPKGQDYLTVIEQSVHTTTVRALADVPGNIYRSEDLEPYSALPERWAIDRTWENCDEINNWVNKHPIRQGEGNYTSMRGYIHSEPLSDDDTIPGNARTRYSGSIAEGFTPITIEQFREITKQSPAMKKIIGYKTPYNLSKEDGSKCISKGDLFVKEEAYYVAANYKYYGLPKEIVETWEPVYEQEEVILYLGNKKTEVKVGRDYIRADNTRFTIDQIEAIYKKVSADTMIATYRVTITAVKIGCTTCSPSELKDIIDTYKELNP